MARRRAASAAAQVRRVLATVRSVRSPSNGSAHATAMTSIRPRLLLPRLGWTGMKADGEREGSSRCRPTPSANLHAAYWTTGHDSRICPNRPSEERRVGTIDPHDELRSARLRRGWSRPDLAEALQRWEYEHGNGRELPVDRNFIYRWETGKRGVSEFYAMRLEALLGIPRDHFIDRRSRRGRAGGSHKEEEPDLDRRDFARTLAGMAAATVLPGAAPGRGPILALQAPDPPFAPRAVAGIRRALLGFGPPGRLAGDGSDPSLAIHALERRVTSAWSLRQQARYVMLADLLPALLADAELATQELPDPQRRSAIRLLVHAFNTAASVLKRLGDTELASIAADRAIRAAKPARDQGDHPLGGRSARTPVGIVTGEPCHLGWPAVDCRARQWTARGVGRRVEALPGGRGSR
jgi:transcriptional regulator with XRE-family HTH domain